MLYVCVFRFFFHFRIFLLFLRRGFILIISNCARHDLFHGPGEGSGVDSDRAKGGFGNRAKKQSPFIVRFGTVQYDDPKNSFCISKYIIIIF